jgi:hypothetical protein
MTMDAGMEWFAFMPARSLPVAQPRPGQGPLDQRLADLPVVTERVGDSSQQPAVRLGDGIDLRRSRGLGLLHDAAGVVDDHQHPLGRPAERLGG